MLFSNPLVASLLLAAACSAGGVDGATDTGSGELPAPTGTDAGPSSTDKPEPCTITKKKDVWSDRLDNSMDANYFQLCGPGEAYVCVSLGSSTQSCGPIDDWTCTGTTLVLEQDSPTNPTLTLEWDEGEDTMSIVPDEPGGTFYRATEWQAMDCSFWF